MTVLSSMARELAPGIVTSGDNVIAGLARERALAALTTEVLSAAPVSSSLALHGPEQWVRAQIGTVERTLSDGTTTTTALFTPTRTEAFAGVAGGLDFHGEWTASQASRQAGAGAHLVLRDGVTGSLYVAPALDEAGRAIAVDGRGIDAGSIRATLTHPDATMLVGAEARFARPHEGLMSEVESMTLGPATVSEATPMPVATAVDQLAARTSGASADDRALLDSLARRADSPIAPHNAVQARPIRYVGALETPEDLSRVFSTPHVWSNTAPHVHIGPTAPPTGADIVHGDVGEAIAAARNRSLQTGRPVMIVRARNGTELQLLRDLPALGKKVANASDGAAAIVTPTTIRTVGPTGELIDLTRVHQQRMRELRHAITEEQLIATTLANDRAKLATLTSGAKVRRRDRSTIDQLTRMIRSMEGELVAARRNVDTASTRAFEATTLLPPQLEPSLQPLHTSVQIAGPTPFTITAPKGPLSDRPNVPTLGTHAEAASLARALAADGSTHIVLPTSLGDHHVYQVHIAPGRLVELGSPAPDTRITYVASGTDWVDFVSREGTIV